MPIKLEQVIEAIEMSDDFFTSFWDTKTGETVILPTHCLTEKPT